MRAAGTGTHAALVIGADTLIAFIPAAGSMHTVSVPLVLPEKADDVAAVLERAFAQLAAQLSAHGRRATRATLVLAPPYVEARLIALPPLQHGEAEAVIRRDAARHFVGATDAKVVAVRMPPRVRRHTDRAPVLAAAAPAQLVEEIRNAALRAGWRIERITPTHAAWIAAAEKNARRSSAGAPIAIVARAADTAHVLRLERGAVALLRRVPVGDAPAIADALGGGPGAASLFADGTVADDITRALTASGWTVVRGANAAHAAAVHAHAAALALLPASVVAERDVRHRALAARLTTAAVLLLLAAAGVHLWGAQRELDAVRAQRAALRPQVAPLLATRDSLDRLRERAATLGSLADAPQWTRALFDVALLLPADAHLLSLRGSGDTLIVSAQGARAGAALQALRGAASLRDVRLQGPIERDLEDGATAVERFTLQARIIAADSAAEARTP